MSGIDPKIEESWKLQLKKEFQSPYFGLLKEFLVQEKQKGSLVFPPGQRIFSAFEHTPFVKVKVVILDRGKDPGRG